MKNGKYIRSTGTQAVNHGKIFAAIAHVIFYLFFKILRRMGKTKA